MNNTKTQKSKIFFLTSMGMFVAILIVMAITPLGALNLGFTTATIAHIPVIIGAIVFGTKAGIFLGACFGALSAITFSTIYAGQLIGYVFSPVMAYSMSGNISDGILLAVFALITAFIPRVLMGFITAKVYKLTSKKMNNTLAITISAIVGSISHTVLFFACLFGLFYPAFLSGMIQMSDLFVGTLTIWTVITGLIESVLAAVLSIAIAKPLIKISHK